MMYKYVTMVMYRHQIANYFNDNGVFIQTLQ
jgi:hypothetical protein